MLKFQIHKGLISGHAFETYFLWEAWNGNRIDRFSRPFPGFARHSKGFRHPPAPAIPVREASAIPRRNLPCGRCDADREAKQDDSRPQARRPFMRLPTSVKILLSMLPRRDARLTGRRNFDASFVVSRQRVLVFLIVAEQFRKAFFFLFIRRFVDRYFQTFQQSGNFSGIGFIMK